MSSHPTDAELRASEASSSPLEVAHAAAVAGHLVSCAECRARLVALRSQPPEPEPGPTMPVAQLGGPPEEGLEPTAPQPRMPLPAGFSGGRIAPLPTRPAALPLTASDPSDPTADQALLQTHVSQPSASGASRAIERGTPIGRYLVLEPLGRGAMGDVVLAYDPALDRKVALKLLRDDLGQGPAGDHFRKQLLREAKALARLAHPHVVAVHDAGVWNGRVFVALEYVEGQTLTRWLTAESRSWREVLRMLCEAGSGLAAAHASGLVHRDFKPDNVLIGRDGRARVTDFGLALVQSGPPSSDGARPTPEPSGPFGGVGGVVGTPAYMGPEQFLGRSADGRTDQFSFGIAAWEALYGERPFAGDDFPTLARNVTRGARAPVPRGHRTPAWVGERISRALETDPARRWPGMAALLEALGDDPAVKRRELGRRLAWATVAAVAIALPVGAWWRDRGTCARVVEAERPHWDPAEVRRALRTLAQTVKETDPTAEERMVGLLRDVEGHVKAWSEVRQQVCVDAREHRVGDASTARRVECLARQRDNLEDLTALLRETRDLNPTEAAEALDGWTPPRACLVTDGEPSAVRDPLCAGLRLARINNLLGVGRIHAAHEVIENEMSRVPDGGCPHEMAHLRMGLVRSRSRLSTNDEKVLISARQVALDAVAAGQDDVAAEARVVIASLLGQNLNRFDEAMVAIREARAAVLRLPDHAYLEARLERMQGNIEVSRGDPAGLEHLRHSVQLLEGMEENAGRLAWALNDLGRAEGAVEHDFTAAMRHFERAIEIADRRIGPMHPDVATFTNNAAEAAKLLHQPERARQLLERSLAIARLGSANDATDLFDGLLSLVDLEMERGDIKAAQKALDEATSLHPELRDSSSRAYFHRATSRLAERLGEPAKALEQARLAADLAAERPGETDLLCDSLLRLYKLAEPVDRALTQKAWRRLEPLLFDDTLAVDDEYIPLLMQLRARVKSP